MRAYSDEASSAGHSISIPVTIPIAGADSATKICVFIMVLILL